ncbi:MAG: mandelate racemase/muconate lactonizing enzyme family protein [Thermomicrobiales bacterium]
MKITDIQVDVLRDPEFAVRGDASLEAVIVRVCTDDGITGIGDASSSPRVVRAVVEAPTFFTLSRSLRELLIGRDPFEIGALWEEMYRLTMYPGRRGAYIHAISAIDVALWDIMGKALGLPVYKLLGGAFQREIRAYASHVMPATPAAVRELAAETVAAGWPALKMGWFPYDTEPARDLAMVQAARDGAGPDARLMLDVGPRWDITRDGRPAVQLWDAKTAAQRIRAWEPYDPFWIEEPLPPDDLDGYRRLTSSVDAYIAAGEEETTRFGLYDLMDRGGIDVIQCDVSRVGGLSEARRVAQAAHDRNRPFAPHCFSTGIVLAASVHLLAASPTAFYLEYTMSDSVLTQKLVYPRLEASNGFVRVPEAPGLGIELDEELVETIRVDR